MTSFLFYSFVCSFLCAHLTVSCSSAIDRNALEQLLLAGVDELNRATPTPALGEGLVLR
jgi:hypothetical protein